MQRIAFRIEKSAGKNKKKKKNRDKRKHCSLLVISQSEAKLIP